MPKYVARTRIKHDTRLYEPGQAIRLSEKEAEPLLAAGAIEAGSEPASEGGAEVLGRFKVLAPFQYQGEKYAEGDVVELPIEEARKREEKLEKLND